MSDDRVIEVGPFEVPDLPSRMARVFVPEGFADQGFKPLLVMFDGQNVFDDEPSFSGGWHVHDVVAAMSPDLYWRPAVVGINHTNEGRLDGLGPFHTRKGGGKADNLLAWAGATLLPMLLAHFELSGGPVGTVVGGSSMGGLASIYAHFARPDLFGGAIVMSPSLWFGKKKVFDFIRHAPTPDPSRIYLDWGSGEGEEMTENAKAMAKHLRSRGYSDEQLRIVEDPDGKHSEADWLRRIPGALSFMFSR